MGGACKQHLILQNSRSDEKLNKRTAKKERQRREEVSLSKHLDALHQQHRRFPDNSSAMPRFPLPLSLCTPGLRRVISAAACCDNLSRTSSTRCWGLSFPGILFDVCAALAKTFEITRGGKFDSLPAGSAAGTVAAVPPAVWQEDHTVG